MMDLTDKSRAQQLEEIISTYSRDPRLIVAEGRERPSIISSLARAGLGIDPLMDIVDITAGQDGQVIVNELLFVMAGIRDSLVGRDRRIQQVIS